MGQTATLLRLSPKGSAFTLWLEVGAGTGSVDSRWPLNEACDTEAQPWAPIGLSVDRPQEAEQGAWPVASAGAACSLLEAPENVGAPKAGLGLLRWWFGCSPAALQRGWGGWGPEDSLKGCEGVVFSHCHCDGLGALVVEEVGCQAGKRGTGASEQKPAVRSLVLAPQGI